MSAEAFTAIDEKLTDIDTKNTTANGSIDTHVFPTTPLPGQSHGGPAEPLPYWLVNVPRDQWPESCPEFLKELSDKNIGILATLDSEYEWIGWDKVKELVS